MVRSYPSVFALGHKAITELLLDPVLVQEKIDGSQISFGWWPDAELPLRVRSKGAEIQVLAPDSMFAAGVAAIRARAETQQLHPGWIYRGEYLAKPKHNALAYDRIPKDHIILFDVEPGLAEYAAPGAVAAEADRLGWEAVPTLYAGVLEDVEMLRRLLDTPSVLGGQKIEGVVVKNYHRFGLDKHVLMGKYVSEAFKEVHAAEWKVANPNRLDVMQDLVRRYRTPARWMKAVQHLRERGELEDSPRDIGKLFKEVPEDVRRECEAEIKEALFAYAWKKHLSRGVTAGLAEWYKDVLLAKQFEPGKEA